MKEPLIIEKDFLQLHPENMGVQKAWKILPGATYKLTYQQLVSLLNDDGDEHYAALAAESHMNLTFTVTFYGRFMSSIYDAVLLFVRELGRSETVYADTEVVTTAFVEIRPIDEVKIFREAYQALLSWEK